MTNEILNGIWSDWQIVREIGHGSFGKVYEVMRVEHGVETRAAVKVISIPQNESEVDSLRSEGLTVDATKTYFQGVVDDFVSEIKLMETFKGVQNIVSVEDFKVVEKNGDIGWDIYIRMELLIPLNTLVCDRALSEQEVIKLGVDICSALELCEKRSIIHRDIKPENIFVNDFGSFKLGDFGIARKLESTMGSLSQKGTYYYMAPEIEKGSQYDATVDLYSLGLVLYRFTNKNRLPFLDTEKQILNPNERMAAIRRRMDGETLPAPCDASESLARIILCACSYDPQKRFSSAAAMKNALLSVANALYKGDINTVRIPARVLQKPDVSRTGTGDAPAQQQREAKKSVDTFGKKRKSKAPLIITLVITVIVLGTAAVFAVKFLGDNPNDTVNETAVEEIKEDNTDTYTPKERKEINAAIKEAGALSDEKDYVGALKKIEDALKTYPESTALIEKQEEYKTVIQEQINSIIDDADILASGGDYEGAIKKIDSALITYPDTASLAEKKDEYEKAIVERDTADALARADEFAKAEDYEQALKVINECLKVYPDSNALIEKKEEYEKAKALAKADELAEEGNFEQAMATIETAMKNNSDDADYTAAYNKYYEQYLANVKSTAIADADKYSKEGNYPEAIKAMKNALKVLPDDKELEKRLESCEKAYISLITSQVDDYIAKEKFDDANKVLNEARLVIPGNDKVADLVKKVENSRPTYLIDMTVTESSRWYSQGDAVISDSVGNSYYSDIGNMFIINHWLGDNGFVTYYLGGEYNKLVLDIAVSQGGGSRYSNLVILANESNILYQSGDVGRDFVPQHIEIDVSGLEWIRFRTGGTRGYDSEVVNFIISNPRLYK